MSKNMKMITAALVFMLILLGFYLYASKNKASAISNYQTCYTQTSSREKNIDNNLEAYHLTRHCDGIEIIQNRIYITHIASQNRTLLYESDSKKELSKKALTIELVWKGSGKLYLVFRGINAENEKKYESQYDVIYVNSNELEFFEEHN